MRRSLLVVSGAALLLGLGGATLQPAGKPPAESKDNASISALIFMAGQWRHVDAEGLTEEHWSAPSGNNVMGMFRWLKPDGTPELFEILAITAEEDGVYLRLSHFNAKLVGREQKDNPMTLKLDLSGKDRAVFRAVEGEKRLASVTYERYSIDGNDRLRIKVTFPEASRESLSFDLERLGSSAK